MPELDGLGASRLICERWPDARPRIIAMTANALAEDRDACFAAGMDDYVAKPIRPELLEDALKRVRRIEREAAPAAEKQTGRLDGDALESLRELGGDEFLAEVIDTFLDEAPVLLATLSRAVEEGDAVEVRRVAHTLKSNGATLGATEFAELCRTLEQQAKDGRLHDAAARAARIDGAFRSLAQSLTDLRSKAAR